MSEQQPNIEEWSQQSDLREALNKALRDLERLKRDKGELRDAVYQAAHDAASTLKIPPVPKPSSDSRKKDAETAIVLLSDWQLGKITPTYSTEVCRERIERLGRKVEKLTAIQRADHPVKELRVYLLGDVVEGELIFPGQSHLIDASLYRQVVSDGPHILANFLRHMASVFERVHVVGVIGNHGAMGGRARRDMHPESNADAMCYEVARILTREEQRITWAPNMTHGERHWFATDTVGDKTWFLFHGDQVKGGFAGFPWYGFAKKLMGWNYSVASFDYAASGHFHTPTNMYLNGMRLWGNGSTESDNTYAAEMLAASGEPCQWLLFQHPSRGVTTEYLVKLEHD